MLYELLPVICLLFPPSFNSILQKGRGLNECQVLYKMGTAQDGGCSSSALAMCTVIPARCWKHKGQGELVVVETWKTDNEAEERNP